MNSIEALKKRQTHVKTDGFGDCYKHRMKTSLTKKLEERMEMIQLSNRIEKTLPYWTEHVLHQFSSVQYEYLYSAIKQDVALHPGSNIKTNTSSVHA